MTIFEAVFSNPSQELAKKAIITASVTAFRHLDLKTFLLILELEINLLIELSLWVVFIHLYLDNNFKSKLVFD